MATCFFLITFSSDFIGFSLKSLGLNKLVRLLESSKPSLGSNHLSRPVVARPVLLYPLWQ
jgi:hypothetical protein